MRFLTRAINTILGWIGLRIVWVKPFQVLVEMAEGSQHGSELYRTLEEVLTKNLRLKNALNARSAQMEELLAKNLRRKNVAHAQPDDGEPLRAHNLVILVTTTSQLNLFELLLGLPAFLAAFRPVVVSYVSARRELLIEFCRSHSLTLYDHNLNPIHLAGDEICKYHESENYRSEAELRYANRSEFRNDLVRDDSVRVEKLGEEIRFIRRLHNAFTRMLSELGIELLVMFEDNPESETGVWIQAAQVLGIPSVIVPFTIADEKEPAEAHFEEASFQVGASKYNELAARLFPHWVFQYKGRELIRQPGSAVIAAEWLGTAQPLPWIHNSTLADAIAAESEAMIDHYRRLGVPQAKLVLTGSLSDDLLYASQESAAAQTGSNTEKPVLLCAFPPNQLSTRRPECEFDDYRALVEFWIDELRRVQGWRVIIKPHPVAPAGDLELLKASGLQVCTTHTATLIPRCSVYLASVSATIRWALAAGKPVINYDVFRYGYSDFDAAPAVTQVRTCEEFSTTLRRYGSDADYLRRQSQVAQADARRWGLLDGKSGERIVALFRGLAEGETITSRATFNVPI